MGDEKLPNPLLYLGGKAKQERDMCVPACPERKEAASQGEFVYLSQYGGYCFTDTPKRTMSWLAEMRLRATMPYDQDVPDTNGKPVIHSSCPFCGCLLPPSGDFSPDGEEAE